MPANISNFYLPRKLVGAWYLGGKHISGRSSYATRRAYLRKIKLDDSDSIPDNDKTGELRCIYALIRPLSQCYIMIESAAPPSEGCHTASRALKTTKMAISPRLRRTALAALLAGQHRYALAQRLHRISSGGTSSHTIAAPTPTYAPTVNRP